MNRNSIIIAIVVCLIFGGCASDELAPANRQSELIRFGTSMRMEPLTKTSYASDVSGGTIYWDTNDAVKIVAVSNGTIASEDIYTVRVNGDKTTGRLEGGGLTWRPGDEYRFYGLYPDTLKLNAGQLRLFVNGTQPKDIDMRQVYMAARTDCGYSSEAVSMEFYPLVTTLTLKVTNETKSSVDLSDIDLTYGGGKYLAGSYAVGIDASGSSSLARDNIAWPENENAVDGVQKFVTIRDKVEIQSGGGIDRFNFLLIPQTYSGKDMTLSFKAKGKEYSADLSAVGTINPGYRYFIDVTIKENGEITIDDALAQLIFALLLKGDHSTGWADYGEYLKKYFNYEKADPDFLDGLYRDLEKMKNAPLNEMASEFNRLFPGEKGTGLIEWLASLKEIDNRGNGPKLTSDSLDLSIFKSATTINLKLEQNTGSTMMICASGLNDLTTVEIKDGTAQKINLRFVDCRDLSTIHVGQNEELQKLELIRTPWFRRADIDNGNRDVTLVSLEDCSTNVDNATINIKGNKNNNNPTIKRVGNTQNVTIFWDEGRKQDPA